MDLAASADALHEPANRIYEWYFLLQLFRRFRAKAKMFPKDFNVQRLRGVSSLRLFDDRVTAYYCGFAGADDYYRRAAAANVVDRIAVPALIIHAANDPFIRMRPETLERIAANPNITYVETGDGGHCAFVGEPDGDGDDGRWAEREVVEFLRTAASAPALELAQLNCTGPFAQTTTLKSTWAQLFELEYCPCYCPRALLHPAFVMRSDIRQGEHRQADNEQPDTCAADRLRVFRAEWKLYRKQIRCAPSRPAKTLALAESVG